ncbi:uncharacterized protein EAF02_004468 [Botrytis sinoallii]|uniref:uncharacterized protein n=1 Tax=Botrytis sinoallii TaxID=1463999 RepID=UPI0019013A29|nr:uncharacterized protein EAF02_004468 [Botrytis sinoallii]KAF7885959.1 hypothetical protein EAF02_004468 [Botrytis sinoallii]
MGCHRPLDIVATLRSSHSPPSSQPQTTRRRPPQSGSINSSKPCAIKKGMRSAIRISWDSSAGYAKLLFHGIKPVFKEEREGRREDAVRTAGRLLGVQMKRRAEEEDSERKRREREGRSRPVEDEEVVPEEQLAYVDEIGMSEQQVQTTRKLYKKDAYHLPELTNGIEVDLVSESEEDDFEDVPVEGLNRLPKAKDDGRNMTYSDFQAREVAERRKEYSNSRRKSNSKPTRMPSEDPDSLFVDDDEDINRAIAMSLQKDQDEDVGLDEEDHINRAIELSLQKAMVRKKAEEEEEDLFEDVPMPEYEQKAVADARPLTKSSGKMIAHMVNNRANAAVPKRKEETEKVDSDSDSDSDMDFQSALRKARSQKAPENSNHLLFGKKKPEELTGEPLEEDEEELAGGFEKEDEEEKAKPLPPWLIGNDDIRSQVQQQRKKDQELNAKDRERAEEDERIFQRDHGVIHVDSDDDNDSDVEVLDKAPTPNIAENSMDDLAEAVKAQPPLSDVPRDRRPSAEPRAEDGLIEESDEPVEWSESDYGDVAPKSNKASGSIPPVEESLDVSSSKSKSPSPVFEDVDLPDVQATEPTQLSTSARKSPTPVFEDVQMADAISTLPSGPTVSDKPPFDDAYDRQEAEAIPDEFDFSDPEEEELMTQLAIEAEEHARFASTLNNKSEKENHDSYEQELKKLRSQQKKDRRDADEVSHIMITECQALLRLFGIPYITAPMEAEAQCAELVRLGLVDGIVTDDSDIFLFGGTRVYKNLFNSNKLVECSDYTEGIPGIGPVTAVEILSEFPSHAGLEEFKEWWSLVQNPLTTPPLASEPTLFRKKFRRSQATKLFLPPAFPSQAVTEAYLKPDVDSTAEAFQWGVPDLGQLREFLMTTVGWSQERVDEILVPVIRDMNRRETEGTQSNITRYLRVVLGWVEWEVVGGDSREKGSKRMREAVGKLKAKKKGGAANSLKDRGTFADNAREWAKKNELSVEAQAKRDASKKGMGKGKGKKRVVEEVDGDEGGEDEDEDVDAEIDNNEADDYGDDDEEEEKGEGSIGSKPKAVGLERGKGKGKSVEGEGKEEEVMEKRRGKGSKDRRSRNEFIYV